MRKAEHYLYLSVALVVLVLGAFQCRAGKESYHPASPVYGQISVNDTIYTLDHSRDTTILHLTSAGKVRLWQLDCWTVQDGRRIGIVYRVELEEGEHTPHDRDAWIRDAADQDDGTVDYYSSAHALSWMLWGSRGDHFKLSHRQGKVLLQFDPITEIIAPRRQLHGFISQP